MNIAPGAEVTPNVRLVKKLGQGGMGSVWLADHLTLKTQVAVKFLADKAVADEAAVARFASEAAAAARIRSPHVVNVMDYGANDGIPYIVMELLEGEDLAARLAREPRLSAEETLRLMRQVAKALAKAHAMGIVHRDIKPANIFLTNPLGDETFVKVLDFGLAKQTMELEPGVTRSDAVFGTPAYMSPEQAESARDATPRSDLWSVAVVAYRCLTGALPFESETLMGLCIAIHEAKFDPPSQVRPGLPAAVDAFFRRALSREPEERFASGAEMMDAMARALDAELPPTLDDARAVPLVADASSKTRRLAMTAAFALTALAIAAFGVSRMTSGAAETRAAAPPSEALVSGRTEPPEEKRTPPEAPSAPISVSASPSAPVSASAPSASLSAFAAPGPHVTNVAAPSSAAPKPGAPGSPRVAVSLTSMQLNSLYEPAFMRSAVGPLLGTISGCFSGAGYEVYSVGVSARGDVDHVTQPGAGAKDPALDACMRATLRKLSLGPTATGNAGEIVLAFVARAAPK